MLLASSGDLGVRAWLLRRALGVPIAVKADTTVLLNGFLEQRFHRSFKFRRRWILARALLELRRHEVNALGDDRVEHGVWPCNRLRTADCAELKLVACERERRCSVAIA